MTTTKNTPPTSPAKHWLKLTALLPLLLASMVSSLSAQETIINGSDVRLTDTDENGTGNSSSFSDSAMVGDSSNNQAVFATLWKFDISLFTAEIAAGNTIKFEVEIDSTLGSPQTFFPTVDFLLSDTPDASVAASDYQNNSLLGTIDLSSSVVGSLISFDVTSVVKAAALSTSNVAFVMRVQNSEASPNNENSIGDVYRFANNSGYLTVAVPEAETYALCAGLLGLATIMIRRRVK